MALELDQPIVRPRKVPEKALPPELDAPSTDGLVQVKIRERGAGKISNGITRNPDDPLSKTEPFGWHKAGELIWVTPHAAEVYDERRWVTIIDDE